MVRPIFSRILVRAASHCQLAPLRLYARVFFATRAYGLYAGVFFGSRKLRLAPQGYAPWTPRSDRSAVRSLPASAADATGDQVVASRVSRQREASYGRTGGPGGGAWARSRGECAAAREC